MATPVLRPDAAPRGLVACLGPTNTGKTHAALEAMLRHPSGVIGLPLRLLAREVYDRLAARLGEQAVALCTGEERRIPPRARYWACTVEAMPAARDFDFCAVDEIQLAADPGRGHVFTDRLLHARGREETWLCGSATMAPLVRRLLPDAELRSRPRLSRLEHVGHVPLKSLPARSAIVAFSAARVVELAEKVRRKHGGAAVVFGALSPRTRNAQVAMFESGEVQHLVATDAIGMGLNLGLDVVALAEAEKFDGRAVRRLRADELAQIAGRAGRFQNDGRFGVTEGARPFGPEMAAAIEQGELPELRTLAWRPEPNLSSLAGLLSSLRARPPHPSLRRVEEADDEAVLAELAGHPEVLRRATSPDRVGLLWEVCRVPDYRKLGAQPHSAQLADIYARLVDRGRVARSVVERRIDQLARIDGEVEELLDRVAAIRTWTYLAWRPGWVEDGAAMAESALAVETLLSDALHARLAERFVDRKARVGGGAAVRLDTGGEVVLGTSVLGRLLGVAWEGPDPAPGVVRALEADVAARVEALVADTGAGFAVLADGRVSWQGGAVARLVPGPHPTEPGVKLLRNALLPAGAALRVQRKVQAFVRDWLFELFSPLRVAGVHPLARGLLYSLERGLGTIAASEANPEALQGAARQALTRVGVRFGVGFVWSEPMLHRLAERGLLHGVFVGRPPEIPSSLVHPGGADLQALRAIGYAPAGHVALRVDRWEALAAELRQRARHGPFLAPGALPAELADLSWEPFLESLGYAKVGDRWRRNRPQRHPWADEVRR